MITRRAFVGGALAVGVWGVPRFVAAADARERVPPAEAADAGKPPALQWKCGPNARIEGNLLIAKKI